MKLRSIGRILGLASLSAGLIFTGHEAGAVPITIQLDLSGIGSFDLNSFSFGLTGSYVNTGSAWQVHAPKASDLMVGLPDLGDLSKLELAASDFTHVLSGDVEFFSSSYSPAVPYLDYQFKDALVTSVQIAGGGGNPEATVTIAFAQLTLDYAKAQNPANPWAALLPTSNEVLTDPQYAGYNACLGTPCPFELDYSYNIPVGAESVDAAFGNSDIVMDAAIPGQLPEPGSLGLLAAGLLGLGALRRRMLRRPLAKSASCFMN